MIQLLLYQLGHFPIKYYWVLILPIIIIVVITFFIIILECLCLLFTRYKNTLSLYDDVITTTVDPFTSSPLYVSYITDNDDFTGLYTYIYRY